MFKYYTEDIYFALRKYTKPYDFQVDIAEHPHGLSLRVYSEQILQFEESQREEILAYLKDCRNEVIKRGINCAIVGVDGAPEL